MPRVVTGRKLDSVQAVKMPVVAQDLDVDGKSQRSPIDLDDKDGRYQGEAGETRAYRTWTKKKSQFRLDD